MWFGRAAIVAVLLRNVFCCVENSFATIEIQIAYDEWATNFSDAKVLGCLEPSEKLEPAVVIWAKLDENIPSLKRGAVSNFQKLKELTISRCGLTEMQPGAFQNLPSFDKLVLQKNKLRDVKKGVMNHLSVTSLFLNYNEIGDVENGAFDDMPNLQLLFLDNNKLVFWYRHFKNSPNLKTLNLFANSIKALPAKSFVHAKKLQVLSLASNEIQIVHPSAFFGLDSLKELDLSKNRLKQLSADVLAPIQNNEFLFLNNNNFTYLPEKFFDHLSYLTAITIHSNPWQCACLKQMFQWSKANQIEVDTYHGACRNDSNPICVNAETDPNTCKEEHDDKLLKLYYTNFIFPKSDCDDPLTLRPDLY